MILVAGANIGMNLQVSVVPDLALLQDHVLKVAFSKEDQMKVKW